jgi:hypothetical protein
MYACLSRSSQSSAILYIYYQGAPGARLLCTRVCQGAHRARSSCTFIIKELWKLGCYVRVFCQGPQGARLFEYVFFKKLDYRVCLLLRSSESSVVWICIYCEAPGA